jgi:hypothetical protein
MPLSFDNAFDLGDTAIDNRQNSDTRSYRGVGIAIIVGTLGHIVDQNDKIIELLTAIKEKV